MTLPDPEAWAAGEVPAVDSAGGLVYLSDEGFGDLLRERANATPDATAVVDAAVDREWTYAEFDDRVSRRAADLASRFDAEFGRVGLLSGTRVAFADCYFATERLGVAVVPLNGRLPPETLRSQAERVGLDCLVCETETASLASDVAPSTVPVVSVDPPESGTVATLARPPDAKPRPRATVDHSLDADRVVMFTSGTTGDPKGVRLTRRTLLASAVGSADRLGVRPGDRWLVCLPMYHTGGLAPLVRSTLYGTTTVLQSAFDAAATARVMRAFDVTGVSLVPTMLRRLLDHEWAPPDSLRFVLLGGAPAPTGLVAAAVDRGVPVYPTYGLTETASQVTTALPPEAVEYPGTVGRPLRNTTVTIRDLPVDETRGRADGTDEVAVGQRGEVVVDGPTVTPGYLDDEQTAAAFGPHGLHTGDVGYRDADGRLWVVGRVDDRIVTGGENVHPARVADALGGTEGVADAAVVGLPDEEWGQRVAALVVPADGDEEVTPDEVRERARDDLADFEVPKTVAVADALPRTASGTVDREAVRDRLAGRDS